MQTRLERRKLEILKLVLLTKYGKTEVIDYKKNSAFEGELDAVGGEGKSVNPQYCKKGRGH